jgi:hypothetical protein
MIYKCDAPVFKLNNLISNKQDYEINDYARLYIIYISTTLILYIIPMTIMTITIHINYYAMCDVACRSGLT